MGEPKRSCGVDRHSSKGFFGRQSEQRARHVHGKARRKKRRCSRVAVGSDRNRHLIFSKLRQGWLFLLLEHVISARQKHGDRACRCHRLCPRLIEILQMIGRKGPILRRQLGSVLVRQLFGMKAHSKSAVRGRLEQALDLIRSEGDVLAKGVDTLRDALLCGGGNKLVDDFADIMRPTVALVRWERMESEERRDDAHRFVRAELICDFEQSKFASWLKPIAGLDLDRGAAAAHQCMKAPSALLQQLLVRGFRGEPDGRCNSAAGLRYIRVARASTAHCMLVGAGSPENKVGVTVDETGSDPGAPEGVNLPRSETCKLGSLADADNPSIGDPDCPIFDQPQRVAGLFLESRDVAVDEQPVPHDLPLGEARCYGKAMSTAWPNLSELLVNDTNVPIGLIGAPLAAGSVTPGACDRSPPLLRQIVKRIGRYDIEAGDSLFTPIHDRGDIDLKGLTIEEATGPIQNEVAKSLGDHALTLLVGGNNAITRPAVLALDIPLDKVGLITLDAHFDMRELDEGLSNGNPVRALMNDGLPGRNIAQIGLSSFANTAKMHRDALDAGNLVVSIDEVRRDGIEKALDEAMEHMAHADAIVLDCDIDVIDRSQMPAAPGARPGGMDVRDFFSAVRRIAGDHRVRVIDLTEWDPSLDSTDLSALTAGRWLAECVAGFENR